MAKDFVLDTKGKLYVTSSGKRFVNSGVVDGTRTIVKLENDSFGKAYKLQKHDDKDVYYINSEQVVARYEDEEA